jgi:hypothetical protein
MSPEDKLRAEVDFVTSVLTHPAGFDLDIFGLLWVRPTDQATFEVEWEDLVDDKKVTGHESFTDPQLAAQCFVQKRAEYRLGVDYEVEDFAKAGLI